MKLQTKHTTHNYNPFIYDDFTYCLYSYNVPICDINLKEHIIAVTKYYDYSATTKRHLRWFFEDTMDWSIGVNDIRKSLKTNTTINGYTVKMLS